jgi:hypothetical protein
MLRGRNRTENGGDASAAEAQPQFKENPQVNAKIDEYIRANPKHWEYIKSMTPDRMARALVLNEVQKQDRQIKMTAGVLKKLDQNPEMKKALQAAVKDVPEDQREKVMVSMAMRAMRSIKPREAQQAPGQGVAV